MKAFPELAENSHEKLTKLDEDWMKSKEGKERWREFIESYALLFSRLAATLHSQIPPSHARYKDKVKDYNFGSLIRTDARQEYGETNTIFGRQSHTSSQSLHLTVPFCF